MNTSLERIEPAISFADAEAKQGRWQSAHDALRACTDFAEVHRPPRYEEFDPAPVLHLVVPVAPNFEWYAGAAVRAIGDPFQICAITRMVMRTLVLERDAILRVTFAETDGVPVLKLSIDGPGRFFDPPAQGFGLSHDFSTIGQFWTVATRGGRIDTRPSQLDLRLKGVRAMPVVPHGCELIIERLRAAERTARLLATGEFASAGAEALSTTLGGILSGFDDQDDPPRPCDLGAIVREYAPEVSDAGGAISTRAVVPADFPPIVVRRNRMTRSMQSLHAMARTAMTLGGEWGLSLAYDWGQRSIVLTATGQGAVDSDAARFYLPTIERGISRHDGEILSDFGTNQFSVIMTVPDVVARTLDEWLPKWEGLAPRSIRMLRLLKSGGPAPPEALILSGVLEDELERRLLPRLGVAPVSTLIHDLRVRSPQLCAASPQRIEKVVSQIKRGKPKKEICAPAYAAEIISMFTIDERHAAAIGLEPGTLADAAGLAQALSQPQVDCLAALRLVARIIRVV